MNNSYAKIASITLYVLFAIGVIIGILFYVGGNVPGTVETGYPVPNITSNALYLAYVYFIIAAILALGLPMIYSQPGKAKSTFVVLGVFLVVILISYLLGSTESLPDTPMSKGAMKAIDGGLIAAYLLLGIAFLGVVYAEISSFFR